VRSLRAAIEKEDFNPGILGIIVNPFYFARRGLHRHISVLAGAFAGKILDVGCGSMPYRNYFQCTQYVGMEVKAHNTTADCYYDGQLFPFRDEEFDGVFSSEVLEHVFTPQQFLQEIHRVLKTGGLLLLSVPFVWDEHEKPFDYARYSSFGLRHLLETGGFEILKSHKTMADIRAICQIINAYIYKKTANRSRRLRTLYMLALTAPCNLIGAVLARILPTGNSDFYLDNVVLARKRAACPSLPLHSPHE
jgi:SAM-dependent methyltransferase